MQRDVEYERARLVAAETPAGRHGHTERVVDRLALGEQLHGDAWTGRTVSELLHEVLEEALDASAWGVLAAQLVQVDMFLPEDRALRILSLLELASQHASEIDRAVMAALAACP